MKKKEEALVADRRFSRGVIRIFYFISEEPVLEFNKSCNNYEGEVMGALSLIGGYRLEAG